MKQIAIELFVSMSKVVKYYVTGQLSFMIYVKMMQSKFKKEEHFKSFIFMSLFCITLVHRRTCFPRYINDHGVLEA